MLRVHQHGRHDIRWKPAMATLISSHTWKINIAFRWSLRVMKIWFCNKRGKSWHFISMYILSQFILLFMHYCKAEQEFIMRGTHNPNSSWKESRYNKYAVYKDVLGKLRNTFGLVNLTRVFPRHHNRVVKLALTLVLTNWSNNENFMKVY